MEALPGLTMAAPLVTINPTVPVPPRVAPELTETLPSTLPLTSMVPSATRVPPVYVLAAEVSNTPGPCLANPAEPEIACPIIRVAGPLSTATVPSVVPKATGRLSVEVPEASAASIAPESVTP